MKKYLLLLTIIILGGCSQNENSKEINIYSQRHYDVDELHYKNFEEKTGIKVNVIKIKIVIMIKKKNK